MADGSGIDELDRLTEDEREGVLAADLEREQRDRDLITRIAAIAADTSNAAEDRIDRIREAIALGPCPDCGSTDEGHATPCGRARDGRGESGADPMDVVNDVACLVDQLRGIADMMTSVNAEELCDRTIARLGYAIEGILERARDRLSAARRSCAFDVPERGVLCRGLDMFLNNCRNDADFVLANNLKRQISREVQS